MMVENPDKKKVEQIKKALEKTEGYCPCNMLRNEDTICPCKDMRENEKCVCKLYIKVEE